MEKGGSVMRKLRKKNVKKPKTLADIAGSLPARFLTLDTDAGSGEQNGLRDYMVDLEAHIGAELGRPVSPFHAAYVMGKLGVSPAVWTAKALGHVPSKKPFVTAADRECAGCGAVKPGCEFNGPVYPGQPQLNVCAVCEDSGVVPPRELFVVKD